MLNAFNARLEARDPAKGHFRSYRLDAGTDLLGNWQVEVTFGRIGAAGRRVRYVVSDPVEARKLVMKTLRRRSTAKKRIGTGYDILELFDPDDWLGQRQAAAEIVVLTTSGRGISNYGKASTTHPERSRRSSV